MRRKRQKEAVPDREEYVAWEVIYKQTDTEERDKLLVYSQLPRHFLKVAIHVHYLGVTVKEPLVIPEEPTESHDLFHVVNYEYDGQEQQVFPHMSLL